MTDPAFPSRRSLRAPAPLPPLELVPEPPAEPAREVVSRQAFEREVKRIDGNFLRIDEAFGTIRRAPSALARTASGARINPDHFAFGMVILGINAAFALGALAASFVGQYEIAPRTFLPPYLWWVVPVAIDFPIMTAAFTGAVYRQRRQGTGRTWALMIVLTIVSTVVNVTRVLDSASYFQGRALDFAGWVGVAIMGIMPSLVLVTWENLARLLIKPTGETGDEDSGAEAATGDVKEHE